jgi:hypothetical protein
MDDAVKGGLLVVFLMLAVGGGAYSWLSSKKENEEADRKRRWNEYDREAEEERQEARRREYEERTRGPCGAEIELINARGESRYICERDVAAWRGDGWIPRQVDAGVQ